MLSVLLKSDLEILIAPELIAGWLGVGLGEGDTMNP